MSREYLVASTTLTVPSTTAQTLGGLNFLNRIKTTNTLSQRVLSGFRFMRWKSIEWRVVFAVSPFVYGCVIVTGMPVTGYRGTLTTDFGLMSHDDCLLVDVTTMPEVCISQPWMFPFEWYDTVFSPTVSNIQPYVSLLVGTPNALFQQNSDAPTSLGVQVFARFEGLELSAFHDPNEVPFESQSFSPGIGATAGVAGVASAIGMNYFTKKATKVVDDTVDAGIGAIMGSKTKSVNKKERTSENAETTVQNASDVIPNVYGGMVFSPQKNLLGDGHQSLPYSAPEHSVMEFLKKPSLIDVGKLSTSGFTYTVFGYCNPFTSNANIESCSRIRFLGQFYRMWRGSINYTFVFFSSPFNTWRLGFRLNFANQPGFGVGDQAYKTVTVRGTNVVNITMPWNFPYTWDSTDPSDSNIDRYTTNVAFENLSVSGPDDAVLYCMVYEAAGDDFQFCSQVEPALNYTDTPFQSQMKVSTFCKHEPIGGAELNIPHKADTGLTFETLAKRWAARPGNSLTTIPTWGETPTSRSLGTFDALSSLFLYYRGMQRFKLAFEEPVVDSPYNIVGVRLDNSKSYDTTGLQDQYRSCDGLAVINLELTQLLEFTVPYVAPIDWQTCQFEDPAILGTWEQYEMLAFTFTPGSISPVSPNFGGGYYVAGGSDFVYSYILPPPYQNSRWYDTTIPPLSNQKSRVDLEENLKERDGVRVTQLPRRPVSKRDRIRSLETYKKCISTNNNQSSQRFDESTSLSEGTVADVL